MKKTAARLAVLTALSLLAIPSAASARPWGGNGFNGLGPASVLLGVQNGQVKVKNVQFVMTCVDAADGTESPRAFFARFNNWENLNQNRFNIEFTANAGGRIGFIRVRGILRSNGTGVARAYVRATGFGEMNEVVERCEGRARVELHRRGN